MVCNLNGWTGGVNAYGDSTTGLKPGTVLYSKDLLTPG
jgi:hypothetical protein